MADGNIWTKEQATDPIREIARSPGLTVTYKLHARERMAERDLIVGDVLYVLKNGFVRMEPVPATREGFMRYAMETRTPNSNGREVRVVAIPDRAQCWIKIVSVMWVDETTTRAGNIFGKEDEE